MLVVPLAICWIAAVGFAALDGRRERIGWSAVAVLAAALAVASWLTWDVIQNGPRTMVAGDWDPGIGIMLRLDPLGGLFTTLSLGVLLATLIYETLGGIRSQSFPALVLFLAAGLSGIFITADIFNFYVFFEISMIAAYILVGYGEDRRQFRAAAIFALVNLLGSVFYLIGVAAVYSITGRLDMDGVATLLTTARATPVILAAALFFIAFSIKLGLFPFHFWLVSVYTGTRPAVAAMLSGALANIGSYGLIRFGGNILPRELDYAEPALIVLGALSIIYGGVQAIARREIPQVLAYSSIGQVGYIMIALALAPKVGFTAVILYSVVNALNKTVLFLGEQLRGRMAGAIFFLGGLSVAGIPPVAGFFGKSLLIEAALQDDRPWLVALIVIGGALSLIYMMQPFIRIFWADPEHEADHPSPVNRRAFVGGLAVFLLLVGIWPQPLLSLSDHAAAVLVGVTP
jgi:multicomponent Na+:H+ antiporter subunit D